MFTSNMLGLFVLLQCVVSSVLSISNDILLNSAKLYNEDSDFSRQKPVLQKDEAWLSINSTLNFPVLLYTQNEECYKCPLVFVHTIARDNRSTIIVNTTFSTTLQLRRDISGTASQEIFCNFQVKFREHGDYWLFIDFTSYDHEQCGVLITNDPPVAEMPILYVFCGLFVLGISLEVIACLIRRYNKRSMTADITDPNNVSKHDLHMKGLRYELSTIDNETTFTKAVAPSSQDMTEPKKKERLRSLDTFRGFSLVIMMFVNYGGGGYWFFEHPPWNGLTVADLVFPWFVFIMGTSMNYSFRSLLKKRKSKWKIVLKIVKRSILLFILGIILNTNWGPWPVNKIRIPGVLQRLSLTYLVVALVEVIFAKKEDLYKDKRWAPFRDIIPFIPEWFIAFVFLTAYICLTLLLPVEGCPTGYLGPGGLSESGKHYNCTGGAAAYIDQKVFGNNHIYQNPTPKVIYQTTAAHDPEGLLGTLTSIFLCFCGLQCGKILLYHKGHVGRVIRWLIWGIITGVIGGVLCGFSKNDGVMPLNKNLWSVSFVLVMASFAFILFSALYIIVDVWQIWKGEPFNFPGMNSIVVYFCHSCFYNFFPVNWVIQNPQHWELLLKAVWDTAIWVILAYIMYRKKVFIAI